MRFPTTTTRVNTKKHATMVGVSWAKMALTINRPIPGHAKMVSTSTEPENRNGSERPMRVMIGRSAFRRACLPITTRSGRPLARAVRM